jgi:hypothetical protein
MSCKKKEEEEVTNLHYDEQCSREPTRPLPLQWDRILRDKLRVSPERHNRPRTVRVEANVWQRHATQKRLLSYRISVNKMYKELSNLKIGFDKYYIKSVTFCSDNE